MSWVSLGQVYIPPYFKGADELNQALNSYSGYTFPTVVYKGYASDDGYYLYQIGKNTKKYYIHNSFFPYVFYINSSKMVTDFSTANDCCYYTDVTSTYEFFGSGAFTIDFGGESPKHFINQYNYGGMILRGLTPMFYWHTDVNGNKHYNGNKFWTPILNGAGQTNDNIKSIPYQKIWKSENPNVSDLNVSIMLNGDVYESDTLYGEYKNANGKTKTFGCQSWTYKNNIYVKNINQKIVNINSDKDAIELSNGKWYFNRKNGDVEWWECGSSDIIKGENFTMLYKTSDSSLSGENKVFTWNGYIEGNNTMEVMVGEVEKWL